MARVRVQRAGHGGNLPSGTGPALAGSPISPPYQNHEFCQALSHENGLETPRERLTREVLLAACAAVSPRVATALLELAGLPPDDQLRLLLDLLGRLQPGVAPRDASSKSPHRPPDQTLGRGAVRIWYGRSKGKLRTTVVIDLDDVVSSELDLIIAILRLQWCA